MKDNGEVEFLDLFDPNQPRSEKDERARRMAICNDCVFFDPFLQMCHKCGCFMKFKTTLDNASCPIGHW
jgi:hypothetical protein